MKECRPVPQSPGLVRADFTGDGRMDFALLLNAGETGKIIDWQGMKLKETRYVFAIFVEDGQGGYKFKPLQRFEDFVPIAAFIDLQKSGDIRGVDGRLAKISNPAVSFVFCEKSEAVYYFSGDRIRTVWVSD